MTIWLQDRRSNYVNLLKHSRLLRKNSSVQLILPHK
jgi:hypothetical protein